MKNVEDIYPLSPMQEMMLLHSLSTRRDDILFNQFRYRLDGPLNIQAFQQAWQGLLDRHPVFRTAFVYEDLNKALQIVRSRLDFPFQILDWQAFSPQQCEREMTAYCKADRRKGFDPAKAPLTRATLIQCAEDTCYLIWSSHHLLLDRWSLPTIFKDLFAFYEAACREQSARITRPQKFRQYIQWLQTKNQTEARTFWQQELLGFDRPSRLTFAVAGQSRAEVLHSEIIFSDKDSSNLRNFVGQQGLTIHTLMQCAWSLLINRYTGRTDIVFGATVSGRNAEIPGVESIVGTFINNLPIRVQLNPKEPLLNWVKRVQSSQLARIPFDYVSLAEIQSLSELQDDESLFDTLMVQLASTVPFLPTGLRLTPLNRSLNTAYPLTFGVSESETSITTVVYLGAGYDTQIPISKLLEEISELIFILVRDADHHCLAEVEGFKSLEAESSPARPVDRKPAISLIHDQKSTVSVTSGREDVGDEVIRELLLSAWKEMLPVAEIGQDDHFFEIGGNSLLAVRLQNLVESGLRRRIPILALFKKPTIRGMANTLEKSDWPLSGEILFPIRSKGHLAPLFCIASPEVNTVGYSLLSRYIDNQRPVHVLQLPPDSENIRRLHPREIPKLAEIYIAEMSKVQRKGPYNLLGMCTGAQISVEMAKKLAEKNQTVAFLGIINTWGYFTVSQLYHFTRLVNRITYYRDRLLRLFRDEGLSGIGVFWGMIYQKLGFKKPRWLYGQSADTQTAPVASPAQKAISAHPDNTVDPWIDEAGWYWKDPKGPKYSGVATVFKTRKQPYWRIRDPALGWTKQIEHVFIEMLPGINHEAILREPGVRTVAGKIGAYLAILPQDHPKKEF